MKLILRRFCFFLNVFGILVATAAAAESPKMKWQFHTRSQTDMPHTTVILVVNGTAFTINKDVVGNFNPLERADYSSHRVPKDAVAACSGWHAGAGDEYYVRVEGNTAVIFHREIDESENSPSYKLIRKIRIPAKKGRE